jgi:hypothetical protein
VTITNKAVGEQINLATVLNSKLEAPILQSEMGLDTVASATGDAVRWDEFSLKHNNDGTFKGIDHADMKLNTSATATQKPVRWDEFSVKHNNDGTFKVGIINQADIGLTSQATATKKAIRWDEFTKRHNNDGTVKQLNYKKSSAANPSATADTFGAIVDLLPATNYTALNPLFFNIVFGGTFGTETVTSDITVTFSDATTTSITKTATAVGTTSLTGTDLMGLIKDGVYINKISVKSKSSIASSTATATFTHAGLYL